MSEFLPNQPVTMDTPVVDVTFGSPASVLPPGTHTFSLVVVDDLGISSDPVPVQVIVQAKPQATLKAPERVPFGRAFRLDGTPDPNARVKITKWIFTRVVGPGPVPPIGNFVLGTFGPGTFGPIESPIGPPNK